MALGTSVGLSLAKFAALLAVRHGVRQGAAVDQCRSNDNYCPGAVTPISASSPLRECRGVHTIGQLPSIRSYKAEKESCPLTCNLRRNFASGLRPPVRSLSCGVQRLLTQSCYFRHESHAVLARNAERSFESTCAPATANRHIAAAGGSQPQRQQRPMNGR